MFCKFQTGKVGCKHFNKNTRNCELKDSGWYVCIEAMKKKPKWSPSSAENFAQCDKKYELGSLRGYRALKVNKAILLGTQFDSQMEKLYNFQEIEDIELTETEVVFEDYGVEKVNAVIQCVKEGIFLPKIQPARTQVTFMYEGKNAWFNGRIDAILDKTDFLDFRIIDFKFTGAPENYTRFSRIFQNVMYMLSQNLNAISLHLYIRPFVNARKGEKQEEYRQRLYQIVKGFPEKYFVEKVFYLDEYRLDDFNDLISAMNRRLRSNIENGYFQKCYTCYAYNSPCEFLSVCRDNQDINDTEIYTRR